VPTGRVTLSARIGPMVADVDLHFAVRKRSRLPGCVDPRPRAVGVSAPVTITKGIEHQGAAVSELQGEPVPSLLVAAQAPAAPFTIEPGETLHVDRLTVADESASNGNAWDGVVVTRRARLVRFAAQSLVAVQTGGRSGCVSRESS